MINEKMVLKHFELLPPNKTAKLIERGPIVVHICDNEVYPIMILNAVTYVGGYDGKPGVSHFLEHVLSNDDDTIGIISEFNKKYRVRDFNAYTSDNRTVYHLGEDGVYIGTDFKSFKEHKEIMENLLKYFFKYFVLMNDYRKGIISEENKKILLDKIERHRRIILAEIDSTSDPYIEEANQEFREAVLTEAGKELNKNYKDTFAILGNKEHIESYTIDDLVEHFTKYYTKERFRVFLNLPYRFITRAQRYEYVDTLEKIVKDAYCHELDGTYPPFLDSSTKDIEYYAKDTTRAVLEVKRKYMSSVTLVYEDTQKPISIRRRSKTGEVIIPPLLEMIIYKCVDRVIRKKLDDVLRSKGLIYYLNTDIDDSPVFNKYGAVSLHFYTNEHEQVYETIKEELLKITINIKDLSDFLFTSNMRQISSTVPELVKLHNNTRVLHNFEYLRRLVFDKKIYDLYDEFTEENTPNVDKYLKEKLEEVKVAILNAKPVFTKFVNE